MYELELNKLIDEIKKNNYKTVLVQLPDGMKKSAEFISDSVYDETGAVVFIWFGGAFGACDIPTGLNLFNIDLIVQWGHNVFRKEFW